MCPSSVVSDFRNFRRAGHAIENVADADRCSNGHARGLHAKQFPAREFHARALLFFRRARFQHQPRNRRNRRQRLAAKSQRRDRQQIVRRAQLRRRVPLERQQRVVVIHAGAVVDHADQPLAARLRLDANRPCACVHRVLEQLLHHRRGPLDNLARRNLVRHILREYPYPAHKLFKGSEL